MTYYAYFLSCPDCNKNIPITKWGFNSAGGFIVVGVCDKCNKRLNFESTCVKEVTECFKRDNAEKITESDKEFLMKLHISPL